MKKHKVYISGQITGLPVAEYVERFSKAEAELMAKGYEVVNPLRYELKPGSRWHEQMKVDIGKATQLCPFWPRRIIPFG